MFQFIHYFNIFIAPLFCLFCVGKGSNYALAAFTLVFVGNPVFDWGITKFVNTEAFKVKGEYKDFNYNIPLYLTIPMQLALLIWAFISGSATYNDALLAGMLCGLSGGIIGIAAGHELTHRKSKFEKNYGKFMLYLINYPHFYIEHAWHHFTVATPRDPDTAIRGESLFKFMPRAIVHGWFTCWKWEGEKAVRKNKKAFSLSNKMLATTFIQLSLIILITLIGGGKWFVIFMVQGLVTLLLLKWINYVEHYGLVRKNINGKLEPVGNKHSWDSTQALTNFSLFNLGFHTPHHTNPRIEYHVLPKASETWNELPAGYTRMMLLALVPSLYIDVMENSLNKLERV